MALWDGDVVVPRRKDWLLHMFMLQLGVWKH